MSTSITGGLRPEIVKAFHEKGCTTPVVGGELLIGAASSGRLVDMVKKRAKRQAESRRVEIVLTDGPPGIGCPVIAAL